MKIYATVKIPSRVSYEKVKDVSYTREFDTAQPFQDILDWGKWMLREKSFEGPGKLPGGPSNEHVFENIELSLKRT